MKKKILYNIISNFALELVTVVCAFILPRLIIVGFGSQYNGIVTSVSQFLSFITLLRAGIGGVTRAALYKPLAENDEKKISSILKSTERFMRRVSYIFLVFLILFAAVYPYAVKQSFDWFFSFSLVLILGITTFAQYYFGITYQILLQADQRLYVYSFLQIAATILNTILSVILINNGIEFRLMKLISGVIFAAIPIYLYLYVQKKYNIIRNVEYNDTAINQRWDAFAHQIAAFVHTNTDLVVLTLFSDLYQVSIYSVYFMVINGVKKFITVFSGGIEAALGRIIAKEQWDKLADGFNIYELTINVASCIGYTTAALLIIPFMNIYTREFIDADYIQPLFSYLLIIAMYLSSIRMPYQSVVEAAGHFKQTRNGAITEAIINICVSIPLATKLGVVGVTIGTICAMLFRTIQYAVYASKNVVKRPIRSFIFRMIASGVLMSGLIVVVDLSNMDQLLLAYSTNYFNWLVEALVTTVAVTLVTLLYNYIIFGKSSKLLFKYVLKKGIGV